MLEKEYRLDFFEERGFTRKQCTECGGHFWTLNEEQERCQDAPCVEFGFIGDPSTDRSLSIPEMRDHFTQFFADRGHTPLPRYPVIARWRDDVFLVHASIYDFQPHMTSGQVEPPANPLVVSQPSIRMPDIGEVGMTGKHQTGFEMMGHHSFNSKENYVYWKEETVEYCHELLTEMGISEDKITYKEHPWIGGGNAGPSLEVLVEGLEVATLVFMNLEKDPDGDHELDGDRYSPLDLNVVDTGYGLERLSWVTDGSPTIYDSVYPDVVRYVCDRAGIEHPLDQDWYRGLIEDYTRLAGRTEDDYSDKDLMETLFERVGDIPMSRDEVIEHLSRLKSVYIIADHSRTIAFMLSDGLVPSNVEEGYLGRMVIRRALRQIDSLEGDISLKDVVEMQMEKFSDVIDLSKKDLVFDMLDNEIEKYDRTLERGKELVRKELEERQDASKTLDLDTLMDFYDTHGIHPTIVKEIGRDFDIEVDIPDDFNEVLADRHAQSSEEEEEDVEEETYDLPETRPIYYENPDLDRFDASVLHCDDGELILDRTLFYPEGGGQPSDRGVIKLDNRRADVKNVRRVDGVIVHEIDGCIPEGEMVQGIIDRERRMNLTRHHSATHVIMSSARKVLGDHIWQKGAQKDVDRARLDISHYRRVTREQIKEIERRANEMVLEDIPVHKEELTRDEAEERFGFELYQGGVPTSDVIRVVHISDVEDYDAQACGGTHVNSTAEIGPIKITGTQSIQDGVERLVYSAGMATVENVQHQEDLLLESADEFSVDVESLPETCERFFKEWKERGKQLEELKEYKAVALAGELEPETVYGVELFVKEVNMDEQGMLSTAERLTSEDDRVVLLASTGEDVRLIFSRSGNLDIDMSQVLREAAREINGGGGGTPEMAQGGGSRAEGREAALEKGRELVIQELG